jgi:RNA polymerase sigma factor (sigma-70 family)
MPNTFRTKALSFWPATAFGSEVCYLYLGAPLETSAFDERYITGLRDRDPDVEAHFVAQFRTPIWAKARRQLSTPDLAEDACQETLLRVLQHFRSGKRLENPASLPAFVHSVCHNVTLEMIRAKTRYRVDNGGREDPIDPGPSPYAAAVTQERIQLVREILARLPEKDRELLRLAMLEEMDRVLLCRRFQVTEDYLRVLLYRARVRFRDELRSRQGAGRAKKKGAD